MTITTRKIRTYWEKHGTKGLLKKALPFLFSYVPLNFYSISHLPINKVQTTCPLEIRKGTIDDINLIIDFFKDDDREITYKQTKHLFDTGGEIFLAFSEGELAHVLRVRHYPGVLKNPIEREPPIEIKKDEVFAGHGQTAERYKGKGIGPAVLQHMMRYAFERGIKRCFISSSSTGKASTRGIAKAGFSFVCRKRRFRVLGKIFETTWSSS